MPRFLSFLFLLVFIYVMFSPPLTSPPQCCAFIFRLLKLHFSGRRRIELEYVRFSLFHFYCRKGSVAFFMFKKTAINSFHILDC